MSSERKRNPLGLIRPDAPSLSFRTSSDGRFSIVNASQAASEFVLVGKGIPVSKKLIKSLSNSNTGNKTQSGGN